MEQYIPKSTLVVEFNRLIAELVEKGEDTMFEQGRISAFEDAKLFLDTLEVKDGDFDAEWERYFEHRGEMATVNVKHLAKHFFELGVNASNSLTWEDIKTIQNISGEVYAEVAKGKDDFYFIYPTEQSFLREVLKRFKAQKGGRG